MSDAKLMITVFILAAGVWLTRFLPFAVFRNTGKMPPVIAYLGKVLPAAMMGLLVVYCLKDCDFLRLSEVLPLCIAVGAVVLLHLWKRNTILSISVGTVLYMVLIRLF